MVWCMNPRQTQILCTARTLKTLDWCRVESWCRQHLTDMVSDMARVTDDHDKRFLLLNSHAESLDLGSPLRTSAVLLALLAAEGSPIVDGGYTELFEPVTAAA